MRLILPRLLTAAVIATAMMTVAPIAAQAACPVDHDQLTTVLKQSVKPSGGPTNGGFDNNEWAAVVDRNGTVCAVTFSGSVVSDQWLGSRAIAAEKASTANAFSLDTNAVSTANLYSGAQPGGYLFGILSSNPPADSLLYTGDPATYGTAKDPFVSHPIGGVVVFAGGLALYDGSKKVGALGVSGDTSCADHNVAWRVRQGLGLDKVPGGVSPAGNDEIVYDIMPNHQSESGYGHPRCGLNSVAIAVHIGAGLEPSWQQSK